MLIVPEDLSAYSSVLAVPDEMNILLLGKNADLTDTIMLLNLDATTHSATLISIPRDLDYQGRKINSYYALYGIHALVSAIEDLVGRKIDHYIVVDMYVFAEIIDTIGGVPVHLTSDLIDPTYRVCDDFGNNCSTLYYPAGDYVLNGVEALRIARSRYTSSDFDRALRQQIIIAGLQEKAQSFGFGNADDVIQILSYMLDATETNISLDQAITYYFRYQNFEVNSGYVLSSSNILSSGLEPVPYETSVAQTVCTDPEDTTTCSSQYFIYTLTGDLWTIRWYVDEVLQEDNL